MIRKGRNKFTSCDIDLGLTQIVVPLCLRKKLLYMAHYIPASGHLGVQKTLDWLQRKFWWSGMSRNVKDYCRTCNTCQRLGKGKSKLKAPLINLPVISKPWSRIAIDIVGPLSVCKKSGHRYVLTVLDLSTHYPLAFLLHNYSAPEVAKCLVQAFSMFGFKFSVRCFANFYA